jgi:hypothetical protein
VQEVLLLMFASNVAPVTEDPCQTTDNYHSYLSILDDHGRTDYGFDAEYGVQVRDDVGVGKIYCHRYRHV